MFYETISECCVYERASNDEEQNRFKEKKSTKVSIDGAPIT